VVVAGIIVIVDILGANGLESIGCAGYGGQKLHCVEVAAKILRE
jgi:hypothetical protein